MPEAAVLPAARPPQSATRHVANPLDLALVVTRGYADRYYPGAKAVVIAIVDAQDRQMTVQVPPADVLDTLPVVDGPLPGALRMPACAVGVIATLLAAARPMPAKEIEEVLAVSPVFHPYSLSSIEKSLAELTRIGLVVNQTRLKPRGYHLNLLG